MRSKSLLAILLALCLVVTMLSPAAYAVKPGEDVYTTGSEVEETIAADEAETSGDTKQSFIGPMRDSAAESDESAGYMPVLGNAVWSATETDIIPSVSLLDKETIACLEELKVAAELYSKDDVVSAFVVMEEAPLADLYTSRSLVSSTLEADLIQKQDIVINSIEKGVLGGEKLEVRYQFTYLTNAFSIKTEFGNLEAIAKMAGVKSVFVTPVYEPAATGTANPNTAASGAMTGVADVWETLGYTGTGMKIAIIDTGLDLDHPSFAADPETNQNSMTTADIAAVLEQLNAYESYGMDLTAEDLYNSVKVPYAFNYVDVSLTADHSRDNAGDHGTHVAGIAAANATEGTSVVGMAPDAQIVVMKVFGANGGAYADDIVAALEDAMTLGVDVVNASLGSPRGFSESGSAEIDMIYERIAAQDTVVCFSAGNEGTSSYNNMWGTDMNRTQNPDNATVGSPSTWANTMSIASAENCEIHTPFFSLTDGTMVHFAGTYQWALGETIGMNVLIDQELEYVIIDGLGNPEDYYDAEGNSLVEGKVAVVYRGTLGFGDKIYNAELAGAVAAVIVNNNDEIIYDFYMNVVVTDEEGNEFLPNIPACMIVMEDGEKMAAAEVKTLTVSAETAPRVVEGGQMSTFSSWGVAPDLSLVPDVTGIGGNVYSCYDGGVYGIMSGTSMSSPQLAGIFALVMQHLYTIYPDAPDGTLRALAEAIVMSTADPIIDSVSGVEASPRQQGAGLVDALAATTTTTYLTVGGGRPKAELGDSTSGVFTFSFEIHNIGDEDKTYNLTSSLLSEVPAGYRLSETEVEFFMYGIDEPLQGTVSFDQDVVTVAAGDIAYVTATVELTAEDMAYLDYCWENGTYIEGYVYLHDANSDADAAELSLPFLGFYGDWTQAPVFDTAYWYDNTFFGYDSATGLPEGDEYWHAIWTSLAGTDWVLGLNPYSGPVIGEDGAIIYDSANNVVSPNGDGVLDGFMDMYISLLRNAKTLTFTYTVGDEVVYRETIENVPKTMYVSSYGRVVPWIYSWYGYNMYDFTDAEGNVLSSGTEVLLTIDAKVDYGMGGDHSIEIPVTVDTAKPQLVSVYELPQEDGSQYLAVEVADDVSLAAVYLMNPSGTRIYDAYYDIWMQDTGYGTYLAVFDITDLGTNFTVAVCDYGGNEGYYDVSYTAAEDGNLPEVDTTQLYAYRVYDSYIMSDHMYGWVSLNKPASAEENANISVWTDDYMEYAAINAAEYVDGKIFAVDAVYNLVVMDPGLFDRQTVTNLGVNVLDMTFDDSTDTMYVLSKQDYYTYLYSMDLLTGELTELKSYGYYYYAPWAIADDDNGTIYAIKYNSSSIYTLDTANDYAMTEVVDGEGNPVVITDSTGAAVSPSANSQSIVWVDGTLYWAYFRFSYYDGGAAELISINTTDWTSYASAYAALAYDETNTLVEYYPATELVGLMAFNETDYQIPESTEAASIALNTESIVLALNDCESLPQSTDLSVSWLPWNYELDKSQLVWTSDNESVATVENGTVKAGTEEGVATITVSYGELTATCKVRVVEISGNFNAYNFYSADGYYGYMINVDLETMDYGLGNYAPVEFLAGDYNGHDGYFYGYDEGGQLYRYDLESNRATALGASLGTYPVDVAYDYSTGMLYALVLDYNTYENTLYAVNMNNGGVMKIAAGMALMNLAISTEGIMYAMDAYGYLNEVQLSTMWDGSSYLAATPVLEEPFGDLYMLGALCWDHNNDVLIWNWCDAATTVWMDVGDRYEMVDDWTGETSADYENGYVVNLGDPTDSGTVQLTGMYVIPYEIPELADYAVESVTAEDMLIFTGYEKVPAVTVAPFNATCQNLVLTSGDTSVVEITENGNLLGISAGTATITATLEDTVGVSNYEVTFNVTVMDAADNMYAHLLTDVSSMASQYWIQLYPGNPGQYDYVGYFDYVIFTAEYVDGKIYTYGYDAMDWTANWQYFVLDAETYEIETQIDMGEAFPYVYDMTYDYTTSTMYLLAGASEDDTQLYMADMETGEIILVTDPEPFLMAIAAGPDGKLYAIENSIQTMDWETYMPVLSNAQLHVIDPLEGTIEWVGDTGIKSNMVSSMAYDYDSASMYWTAFAQENSYISNLAIVDLETGVATSLGTIGTAGAQVGGLYFICDEYPEADDSTLHNVVLTSGNETISVGETVDLSAMVIPGGLDVQTGWTSSDRNIATVDENGVVTGVAQGKATITFTAYFNGVTKTATCDVAVLNADASFLTYNVTDGGWAHINRGDYTLVTNLTEGVEETAVTSIVSIGTDVYGYDVNGQLFQLNTETYERTNIGDGLGMEVDTENGFKAVVKDMAYDSANEQVIVLIDTLLWEDWSGEYSEIYGGCALYTVDLETGALTQLYVFEEYAYVYAISADNAGNVFFYTTFDDSVNKYNLETGAISTIITLQTQSIYGDMYCDYSMHYDALSNTIYLLFTGNGNFYKMITIDVSTGALVDNGYVGEIISEENSWGGHTYMGDMFNGLTFIFVESDVPADPDDPFEPSVPVIPSYPSFPSYPSTPSEPEEPEQPEEPVVENPFVDVIEGAYYYDAVLWAVENGITTGTSETTFTPDGTCTRGQVVTFLWRAAGCPVVEAENPFTDVVEGAYYYEAVLWAVENGITNGVTATAFDPNGTCTRGQVVTFLWRAAGCPEVVAENSFSDVAEGAYYYNAVLWAVENGITNGVGGDSFAPAEDCTRGSVVTFIYRAYAE